MKKSYAVLRLSRLSIPTISEYEDSYDVFETLVFFDTEEEALTEIKGMLKTEKRREIYTIKKVYSNLD